jgi:hypothetical protein
MSFMMSYLRWCRMISDAEEARGERVRIATHPIPLRAAFLGPDMLLC